MQNYQYPTTTEINLIVSRPEDRGQRDLRIVQEILDAVKSKGDAAVVNYTKQFDKFDLNPIKISQDEINQSENIISAKLKTAIEIAQKNIEEFHKHQKITEEPVETFPGIKCWRKAVPIDAVGLYVPGGSAPLFSTLLMLGIPAKIAGCKNIVVCTPAPGNGTVHPATLFAAKILGISDIFRIGGAQAIAAMAYGTKSIPKVDKIFGPGNAFVTMAKRLASLESVAIDMPAGPSEVCVIADETANPKYVAADLLAQAEHGTDSQVICITDSKVLFNTIQEEVRIQIEALPRKKEAGGALQHSRIVLVKNLEEAIKISNLYAPEHLIISTANPDTIVKQITNAGSVFIGKWTPEVAGDYASGTNHSLPTGGHARAYSGVSVHSFQKVITYQSISEEGLKNLGPHIMEMADAEGLNAHSRSIGIRIGK